MRARRFAPAQIPNDQPLMSLNMTPLIDVLLVLIVMMILAVPIMTHKVPIDLPQPSPAPTEPRVVHRIDLAANGGLAWDGNAIAVADLPGRLAAMQRDPNAELHVAADPSARYERFDQTLATIKLAGVTRLGFADNARFAQFDAR